jgi:hypothetical protein
VQTLSVVADRLVWLVAGNNGMLSVVLVLTTLAGDVSWGYVILSGGVARFPLRCGACLAAAPRGSDWAPFAGSA